MAKKRKQRVMLDAATKQNILAEVKGGMSIEMASKTFGISKSAISRWRSEGVASAAPVGAGANVKDAISYLRHAKRKLLASIRSGQITEPDGVHLLTLLALRTLEGAA